MRTLEDMYPLSPLQEGMLFHTLYETGSELYFEQSNYHLENTQIPEFQKAWELVVAQHGAMRSSFLLERGKQALQVVWPKVA